MKVIFSRYRALKPWVACFKFALAYLEMFLEVGNARVPKRLHLFCKNGTEKHFASQWLSTSPNIMISFKFYVQTPSFIIFITLHLGKSHIHTVNTGQQAFWPTETASATASLFSGVDSILAELCSHLIWGMLKSLSTNVFSFKWLNTSWTLVTSGPNAIIDFLKGISRKDLQMTAIVMYQNQSKLR